MKKILALVLALMLVLAGLSAFAENTGDEPTGKNITLKGGIKGHTYTAYQIFVGDYKATNTLENIQWGNGVTDAYINGRTAAAAAKAIHDANDARALAKELVDGNYLQNGVAGTMGADGGNVTWTGLTEGYYVIVDTAATGTPETDNVFSEYIVQLVDDVNMDLKMSTTTIVKKVQDNDNNKPWNDAADYNIGDDVPYKLTVTLAGNYEDFEHYQFKITDTLSKGQKLNSGLKIMFGETDITSSFTVTTNPDAPTGAQPTTITIEPAATVNLTNPEATIHDLKSVSGLKNNSVITVTYTAKLTKDAEIGLPGNPNEVDLEYSNNPEDEGRGTTKTPKDYTVVFVYELDVTKVDGKDANVTLEGAKFVLKATDGDHKDQFVTVDATGKVSGWVATQPKAKEEKTGDDAADDAGVLVSDKDGKFIISGLDAGKYELKEIVAPEGYNLLTDAIPLEIIATQENLDTYKEQESTDAPDEVLTDLKIKIGDHEAVEGDDDKGIVDATVENNSGMTLPETGGIGTTIFYIAGSILVLAAVVLLVTKRRMNAEK